MLRHDEIDRFRLGQRWNLYQSDNTRVTLPAQEYQFTEIFVQGDQNALLLHRTPQNEFVAGIGKNVATPKYIVRVFAQRPNSPTPHAAVQEQLQAAAGTGSGKTVSEPTVARAYSKQAKISSRSSQG